MRELTQIRDAVIRALCEAGVTALAAFPEGKAKQYGGAVVTVAVGAAEGKAMALNNYLGEVYDEAAGTVRELYGRQLEGDISVSVRGERAADCETGCETVTDVLLGRLPAGIRPQQLSWEALTWEKSTAMFLRKGSLRCQAVFTARAQEDGEVFDDFILKGVLQN